MKRIFIFLLMFVSVFAFSQQKLSITKASTKYYDRLYQSSLTDTTELVSLVGLDSIQVFISASDSVTTDIKFLYGDGIKSSILSSIADSLISLSTSGGFKGIPFARITSTCGSIPMAFRVVTAFRSSGNETGGIAKYSVYIKKFRH